MMLNAHGEQDSRVAKGKPRVVPLRYETRVRGRLTSLNVWTVRRAWRESVVDPGRSAESMGTSHVVESGSEEDETSECIAVCATAEIDGPCGCLSRSKVALVCKQCG